MTDETKSEFQKRDKEPEKILTPEQISGKIRTLENTMNNLMRAVHDEAYFAPVEDKTGQPIQGQEHRVPTGDAIDMILKMLDKSIVVNEQNIRRN